MLADKGDGSEAALHQHGGFEPPHDELCSWIDRQCGKGFASIVSIPYENLACASIEESRNSRIDFTRQELAQFRIFRISLLLAAHAGNSFRIRDDEHALVLREKWKCNESE